MTTSVVCHNAAISSQVFDITDGITIECSIVYTTHPHESALNVFYEKLEYNGAVIKGQSLCFD